MTQLPKRPACLVPLLLFPSVTPAAREAVDPILASYRAHVAAAEAALRDGDVGSALEWLDGAPAQYAGWELSALRARTDQSLAVWRGHTAEVGGLCWSPSGDRVASTSSDGTVRVWDAGSGEMRRVLSIEGAAPQSVGWDATGERLACAYADGSLALWGAEGDEPAVRWGPPAGLAKAQNRTPHAIVWSPMGTELVVVRAGRIDVHAATSGELLQEITGSRPWPMACCARYDRTGERLVSAFWDGLVLIHDTASHELLERREPAPELEGFHAFHDLVFDPSGERLGGACFDGSVRVHSLGEGSGFEGRVERALQCFTVAFCPTGDRLAAGYANGALRIWDATNGALTATLLGHVGAVSQVAFAPDGERLASCSVDGTVRLWDTRELSGAHGTIVAGDAIWSAPFSPDGRRLATASSDGRATLWDLATGRPTHSFGPFSKEAVDVVFTPSGEQLILATNETVLRMFDLAQGSEPSEPVELRGHEHGVPNLAVSPDGGRLASASYDGTLRIWDLASEACERVLAAQVYDCAFAPDGSRLALNDGAAVVVVEVASGSELVRLMDPSVPGEVRALRWSPDGRWLVSGHQDGGLVVWDVEGGRLQRAHPRAHGTLVYGVAFHPDGQRFASASYDGTVKLWSPEAPLELCTFRDLPDKAYSLEFSPDGERLAVSTIDGSVTLFDTRYLRERRSR